MSAIRFQVFIWWQHDLENITISMLPLIITMPLLSLGLFDKMSWLLRIWDLRPVQISVLLLPYNLAFEVGHRGLPNLHLCGKTSSVPFLLLFPPFTTEPQLYPNVELAWKHEEMTRWNGPRASSATRHLWLKARDLTNKTLNRLPWKMNGTSIWWYPKQSLKKRDHRVQIKRTYSKDEKVEGG